MILGVQHPFGGPHSLWGVRFGGQIAVLTDALTPKVRHYLTV